MVLIKEFPNYCFDKKKLYSKTGREIIIVHVTFYPNVRIISINKLKL